MMFSFGDNIVDAIGNKVSAVLPEFERVVNDDLTTLSPGQTTEMGLRYPQDAPEEFYPIGLRVINPTEETISIDDAIVIAAGSDKMLRRVHTGVNDIEYSEIIMMSGGLISRDPITNVYDIYGQPDESFEGDYDTFHRYYYSRF